jgi:dihydropyrimidinase
MYDFDLVVKGGTIVNESGALVRDVGIRNGEIAAIGDCGNGFSGPSFDAAGMYVFPGGIDVHTHLAVAAGGTISSDDFTTGTIAAACGGTTTIIDFVTQNRGEPLAEAIAGRQRQALGRAVIDYGFHVSPTVVDQETLTAIPSLVADGYPSFKFYLTYDNLRVTDGELIAAMAKIGESGGLVCVHAENNYMIDYLVKELRAAGKTGPRYHPLSRPPLVEGEATGRAIRLARLVDAPIYIVHVTCQDSLDEISRSRANGDPVMGETCPQYLLLSCDRYDEPDFQGAKYVMSPPLRPVKNQPLLWDALANDQLQVVSTDHCPFNFKGQKDLGKNFFGEIPNGVPGIEARLALLYSFGVCQKRLSLQRFVEVTAANPARIFGLYPQKGTIAVGSDADLVVFNPGMEMTITKNILHESVDYTPYEGMRVTGYPAATIARGKIIVQNGMFVGSVGSGKFLRRKRPVLV